jgi:hypothetical protein
VSQLSGVLLAHWEHEIIDDTVKLINECPFGVFEVEFRSIVWAPKIGQKLCECGRGFLSFDCAVWTGDPSPALRAGLLISSSLSDSGHCSTLP